MFTLPANEAVEKPCCNRFVVLFDVGGFKRPLPPRKLTLGAIVGDSMVRAGLKQLLRARDLLSTPPSGCCRSHLMNLTEVVNHTEQQPLRVHFPFAAKREDQRAVSESILRFVF
jgi:hypothetical protein